MRRRTILDDVMAEHIIYGGTLATRAEVYDDVIALGHPARTADMFAFGPRAVAVDPGDHADRLTLKRLREIESSRAGGHPSPQNNMLQC